MSVHPGSVRGSRIAVFEEGGEGGFRLDTLMESKHRRSKAPLNPIILFVDS